MPFLAYNVCKNRQAAGKQFVMGLLSDGCQIRNNLPLYWRELFASLIMAAAREFGIYIVRCFVLFRIMAD